MIFSSMKILFLGPQGSGKGTQAKLLAASLRLPMFSMGQLLRDEVAAKTDLGSQINEILLSGELVPASVTAEVLQMRLAKPDAQQGYILDGFPRNEEQYQSFTFEQPTHVFVIMIPEEETYRRLGDRLTCSVCGYVTSTKLGFKKEDPCPLHDGGLLIQRTDDTPEAITKRLEIYEQDTQPVIRSYRRQGIVYEIDGVGSVEEVHQRILDALRTS
ncbi:TPA: adenylate kinase [Candidatus Uhrbacteria bacterium]|nr:adenylate kinase [Candidatus Uhrbacteria bacterium]HCB18872.1 adenylate kinase [Candidatus Uhrbacteria bacterium]